jgi:hypothetical protein
MYVQARGSVWEMGVLTSGGEVGTGGATVGGWSCDCGLTSLRSWDMFWEEERGCRCVRKMNKKSGVEKFEGNRGDANSCWSERGEEEMDNLRSLSPTRSKKTRSARVRICPVVLLQRRSPHRRHLAQHSQRTVDGDILGRRRTTTTHLNRR